jgi:hypothetical protein
MASSGSRPHPVPAREHVRPQIAEQTELKLALSYPEHGIEQLSPNHPSLEGQDR